MGGRALEFNFDLLSYEWSDLIVIRIESDTNISKVES